MASPYTLLKFLSESRFSSGTGIAAALGVSRAAVCKSVRRLQELGVVVDAVPGRGYRLRDPVDLLDPAEIRRGSAAVSAKVGELYCFEELDSTNRFLLQKARQGVTNPQICLAERQTAGRGRRGRSWYSPFAANIYASVLWSFMRPASELGALGLAMGVATVRALEILGCRDLGLKWPNDIHWQGRKLGGLLLELAACEADGPCRVVVGLGLNVRMPRGSGTDDIGQPWTDVATVLGGTGPSRSGIAAVVLEQMVVALEAFDTHGITPFLEDWRRLDLAAGRPLELHLGERLCRGTGKGIDVQGRLLMETEGRIDAFAAGEVSLRLSS